MPRSAAHRSRLVAKLRSRGALRTPAIIDAFREVPRELFAPDGVALGSAYDDRALVLTEDAAGRATSTISQPSMVALMIDQLGVRSGDRVLEIGTASGYNAALLAALAGPDGAVHSIELDPDLADRARDRLSVVAPQVTVLTGDGWVGAPEAAPFDRIVVTVGVDDLAPAWTEQLADRGTLVAPVTLAPGLELSVELLHAGPELHSASVQPCGFVRLRGPHAAGPNRVTTSAGTVMTRDALDSDDAQRIRDVVDCDPQDGGPLPELVSGWSTWLVLEVPEALVLSGSGSHAVARIGLWDRRTGGIALVDSGRIAYFGDAAAADHLRAKLCRAVPVDQRELQVVLRPSRAAAPPTPWVINRPNHRFGLWLGGSGPGAAPYLLTE